MNDHPYAAPLVFGALSISIMIVLQGASIRSALDRIARALEALTKDDAE